MSATLWRSTPFAIHLDMTSIEARRIEDEANEAGAVVVRLSLQGVQTRQQLCSRLAETFMFPHESSGLDAAVDLISDLEWLGNSDGHLLVIDADGVPTTVMLDVAHILPAIVDRWRSQGLPFVAVVQELMNRRAFIGALKEANRALDEFAALPWAQPGTGSVTIVNHHAG